MELKKAKYTVRTVGLLHVLALSSSVVSQGFFSVAPPRKYEAADSC